MGLKISKFRNYKFIRIIVNKYRIIHEDLCIFLICIKLNINVKFYMRA